jgi:hypothetical protein
MKAVRRAIGGTIIALCAVILLMWFFANGY